MIVTVIRVIRVIVFVCFMCFAAAMLFLAILDIVHKEREREERMERQARAAKLKYGDQCPATFGTVDNKCHLCRYYGGMQEPFVILCHGAEKAQK